MSKQWGLVYETGVWVSGGFVTFLLFLAWARYLKRWGQREQIIQEMKKKKGDANDRTTNRRAKRRD